MIRIETRKRKTPQISMAPLVDCMLLLFIFFLLTSSFSEKRGIEILLPQSTTAEEPEKQTIEIVVSDTGKIMLEGKALSVEALTEALKVKVNEQGMKPVFMLADRLLPLGKVTEVLDSIRAANLETVSIATRQKQKNDQQEQEENE